MPSQALTVSLSRAVSPNGRFPRVIAIAVDVGAELTKTQGAVEHDGAHWPLVVVVVRGCGVARINAAIAICTRAG